MNDKKIKLRILNYFTNYISINIKIFQNLFLFSIFYLFYNANFLKTFIDEKLKLITTKYINDVKITITNINSKKKQSQINDFQQTNYELNQKTFFYIRFRQISIDTFFYIRFRQISIDTFLKLITNKKSRF